MAKKNRKQKQRATRRPAPQAGPRPVATAPRVAPSVSPRTAAPVIGDDEDREPVRAAAPAAPRAGDAFRRRVERVSPAGPSAEALRQQRLAARSARYSSSSAASIAMLESDDPGIPFDHVPYVPADLRRVAVIASVMVVLILIAWGVVSQVVH
jgi:hypothetical protein